MTKHKRNIIAMHKAALEKRERMIKHVKVSIKHMIDQNESITFSNIARLSKVSKAWLYRNSVIRTKIEKLRLKAFQYNTCF